MAILNQKRILNLIPKISAPVTIHVSQGDVGTEIEFTLVKGDELFVNTGSLSASVHGVREDGANFGVFTCTLSGSSVKFPLHAEMTAVKGSAIAEIVLVDSQGNKVGSSNFGIMVEESVFPLGVTYDNDVSVYESILAYVQTIPAQVEADFNTAIAQEASTRSSQIQTLTNNLSAETTARSSQIQTLTNNLSAETTARQNADASLREAIDALVSPTGQSVVVDRSLSMSGAAADAKVVGNHITSLFENVVNNIVGGYVTQYGVSTHSSFSYTDYIPLVVGSVLNIHTYIYASACIVFYDINKDYVSHLAQPSATAETSEYTLSNYVVPPTVAYVRISCLTANIGSLTYNYSVPAILRKASRSIHAPVETANGSIDSDAQMVAPYDDFDTLPVNTIITFNRVTNPPAHAPIDGKLYCNAMTFSSYISELHTAITQIVAYSDGDSYIRTGWGWNSSTQKANWSAWKSLSSDVVEKYSKFYNYQKYYFATVLKDLIIDNTKTVVVIGDSIPNGVTSIEGGADYHTSGFVGELATLSGCTVKNYAVASSCFAPSDNVEYDSTIITQLTNNDITGDIMLIAGGTNDFGFGNSMSDFENYVGQTFDYIDAHFNGKVCVILPFTRTYDGQYSILPLNDYREKLYEMAIAKGYSVINGTEIGFPETNGYLKNLLIADGLHPTDKGHKQIGNLIYNLVKA